MPSGIPAQTLSSASGMILPDNWGVGAHYSDPLDGRGYRSALVHLFAGTNGTNGTVDVKVQAADPAHIVHDTDLSADTGLGLNLGSADNVNLAVSFTTPNNGGVTVTQIQARFKQVGSIADGKAVKVTIEGDSSGSPDGSPLFTAVAADVEPDNVSTSDYQTLTFDLSSAPVHLAANTTYHLVFSATYTASATDYLLLGIDTVTSGGNVNIKDTTWGGTVSTQQGHVSVYGHDWADISGAAFTQVTESNDNAVYVGTVDLDAASSKWLRLVGTVGTAACDFGASIMLVDPQSVPSAQFFAFEV